MSMLYAMFLVVAGICCYLADVYILKGRDVIEAYNIFLCIVGLLWIGWLQYDVQNYVKFILKYWKSQSI